MSEPYSEKVLQHFQNPQNVGIIEKPSGEATVGNTACGDIMQLGIVVKNNIIKDIKFKTFGCAAAIATCSMLTEVAKGKTLEEALKLQKQDIVDALGGLPKIKIHCSLLGVSALKKAIENYLEKTDPI